MKKGIAILFGVFLSTTAWADTVYQVVVMKMKESTMREVCSARTGVAGKCVMWVAPQRKCVMMVPDVDIDLAGTRFFIDSMAYCYRLASKVN